MSWGREEKEMPVRFRSRIQVMILIGSGLMVAACATVKTNETNTNITHDTTRLTIEKGKLETPPAMTAEPQPVAPTKASEPVKTASDTAPDVTRTARITVTRIKQEETFVNVRTAPSVRSRNFAVIKGGQTVEVLITMDRWLKIKWQKGDAVMQGWINKKFVEAYDQER